jgi:hypothetical protein
MVFYLFSASSLKSAELPKTSASGETLAIHVTGIQKYALIDLIIKQLQSDRKMVKQASLRAAKMGEFIFEVALKISPEEFVATNKEIQVGDLKLILTEQEKEKLIYDVQE